MHQSVQGATFHVEHIVPKSRGELSQLDNLAWACPGCNLHKADRVEIAAVDGSGTVPIFNPRSDNWQNHFHLDEYHIVGLTEIGQATFAALDLNNERRVRIHAVEELFELFPPSDCLPKTLNEELGWFRKYKGGINNELSAAGYDLEQAKKIVKSTAGPVPAAESTS